MKKMKIGVDLDDVVFEFVPELLKSFERKYSKKVLFEEVDSYFFSHIFEIEFDEVLELIKNICLKKLPFSPYSQEVLISLSDNFKIYFITSRIFRENTLETLEKYFSEIDFELIFSSNPYSGVGGKTKGEICEELEIDFMVEDSKEHAKDCIEKGIRTFLLDKPWNKNFQHEKIIRVKNWKEILEKLK